mgnify:CR=1 FL=1
MNEDNLGSAVVLQAVKDYRIARKKLARLPKSNKKRILERRIQAEEMIRDCEEFFKSERFNVFSTLDGKMLLDKLQEEDFKNTYRRKDSYGF